MFKELCNAFLLIFLAEMGDKTQIIAMSFATKYLIKDVIIGITLGVVANHGMAIIAGKVLSQSNSLVLIQILAGFMFVLFGFTSLDDKKLDEFEDKRILNPILTVALAFFIGELGDKTQLTALTLAIESNYTILILIGTTMGMIATSLLGIFIGSKIGHRIPELPMKILSSMVFFTLGILKIIKSMEDIRIITDNIVLLIVLLVVTEVFLISRLIRSNKSKKEFTAMKKVAYDIHKQTQVLKKTIDEICLGEKKCGKCIGKHCLIGYIRFILDDARENFNYYDNYHINLDFLAKKNYDSKEVVKALSIILLDYDKYGWNSDQNFIVNKIRYGLEYILIGRTLSEVSGLKNYINIFMKINKSLGYDLGKEIISNRNKDDSYFLVEDG